jgi:hypothetical protein
LLTGCAGTLIEASRTDADIAVFVVHVFISDAADEQKVLLNNDDYIRFLNCLRCLENANTGDGVLIGPLRVPGGPFVPSEIPLYIGKTKTRVRYKKNII